MAEKDRKNCEINVIQALSSSPRIRLLVQALNDSGCPFLPNRHVDCSPCDQSLSGGYDDQTNQVIICSNNCQTPEKVEEILSHELVHMYDYCTAKIDFSNQKHLACSEIRAATLSSCAKFSWDFWSFEDCVESKASKSVAWVNNIDEKEARKVVKSVFDKCYNDLEPFGRKYKPSNSASKTFCSDYLLYNQYKRSINEK